MSRSRAHKYPAISLYRPITPSSSTPKASPPALSSPSQARTTRTTRRRAGRSASPSPRADTVRLVSPRDSLVLTLLVFVSPDQFYVFAPRAAPPPPSKLSASDFTPELDLVGAALSRDGPASEEVVSLTSGKSGLRIGFSTNRECPPPARSRSTPQADPPARGHIAQSPACSSTRTTLRCPRRARGRRSMAARARSATGTAQAVSVLSVTLRPLPPPSVPSPCDDCVNADPCAQPPLSWSSTRRSRRGSTRGHAARRARTRSWRRARCTTTLCGWTCGTRARGPREPSSLAGPTVMHGRWSRAGQDSGVGFRGSKVCLI